MMPPDQIDLNDCGLQIRFDGAGWGGRRRYDARPM